MQWTTENKRALKSMWLDGMTSGEIAEDFGISRSAVLGKLHRLGALKTRRKKPRFRIPKRKRQPILPAPKPDRKGRATLPVFTNRTAVRTHIPGGATKAELRRQIEQAMANTAALPIT